MTKPTRRFGQRPADLVFLGVSTLALMAATVPAWGQTVAPEAATDGRLQLAQAAAVQAFDIPAQSLRTALIAFGQQADMQITFDPGITAGRRASALSGQFRPEEALRRLLADSDLAYRYTGPRTIAISETAVQGNGNLTLSPITVQAQSETATGPVDGYVATRSASATKTDTPLIETPRAVSVVTAEEIKDRKARNVEDALGYTAGVQVSVNGDDPRFDQISVRGFDVTTTADFRDGMRQANTGWLSYYRTQPYGLERVEVVKGPNSVLYGQVSPGGMVNRVTKRPTATAQHEVEVQIGTDDHHQGQFDMSGPLTEDATLQYRVVGLAKESDTDLTGVIEDDLYFAPSFTWAPTDATTVTLFGEAQNYETSGSPRPYQWSNGDLSHFWAGDVDFDRLDQTQYLVGYEAEHSLNDTFTLRQNLRFGDVDTENQYLSSSLQADNRTFSRTAYGVYEDMQTLVVDTSLETRLTTGPVKHTILTGIDHSNIDAHVEYKSGGAPSLDLYAPDYHQPVPDPSTYITHQDIDASQTGIYAQDQLAWANWRLSFGLRHDWAEKERTNLLTDTSSDQEDQATTGSVGLVYLFDNGLAPYASYATSFVPEVGTDLYGEAYDPTEGEQYEVGVKYQPPGTNGYVTASLFNLTEKNVLTTDPANVNNSIQTGEVRSRGLELEAKVELSPDTSVLGAYTYQDIEITESTNGDEGNRPTAKPEHMVSAWAAHSFSSGAFDGLEIGAGGRWVGSSYKTNQNTEKNDSYAIFDARVAYALDDVLPGATMAVNATNLADNEYIMCEAGYCYRGRGRTVIASLNYAW